MNNPYSQPTPYSRYQSASGKPAPGSRNAAGSASGSGQYHRYRYGRHARTPRDPESGQQ